MSIHRVNSHLQQPAKTTAWPHGRAAAVLFAALLSSFAFPALASAAVATPEKLGGASGPLDGGVLVSLNDILAQVADTLEFTVQSGLLDRAAMGDKGGMTPGAPRDSLPGDTLPENTERIQDLGDGLLPVQSSSSTTGTGGSGPGGGGTFALALASPALSAADCMITRLALADQLFPPSPPLCGIFHPPRAI